MIYSTAYSLCDTLYDPWNVCVYVCMYVMYVWCTYVLYVCMYVCNVMYVCMYVMYVCM